jgi:hypothetical protein
MVFQAFWALRRKQEEQADEVDWRDASVLAGMEV